MRAVLASAAPAAPVGEDAPGRYAQLYEAHAQALPPESSIGGGDYEAMGEVMLSALVLAGLREDHTLVDFGCGTGRLAVHAIPYLRRGRYLGIDISETMLVHARQRVGQLDVGDCVVEFALQKGTTFALDDASVDVIAAFSVFTHMEHEDTYLYLRDARRVVREGGRFVASLLALDVGGHHEVFLRSAALPFERRWDEIRHVLTTHDHFGAMAWLSGWHMSGWYRGDVASIPARDDPTRLDYLGQSVAILEPSAAPSWVDDWWERHRLGQ